MKNIILVIVGLIVIGLAGRAFWAWQQMKIAEQPATQQQVAPVVAVNAITASTQPEQPLNVNNTRIPIMKCNLVPKNDYVVIAGKVIFPQGVSMETRKSYDILDDNEKLYPIASDGSFCTYAGKAPYAVLAISRNIENSWRLALPVISDYDINDAVIDSTSTLEYTVLILLLNLLQNPLISDQEIFLKANDLVKNNPDIKKCASKADTLKHLILSDLDKGGRLYSCVSDSLASILKQLPATRE